ncbi:helicase RepA family protein [Plastoroseomonas hellenica]|uniref:helicase RepA family protein n=1 Tax=Plastoroseomonas hellenica TaxID=2687306 RepID=UPI001BA75241|nr:helicase RepA family protein [Plastoroseomonas hellenica]MBR0647537.1 AAA family ATPase [Plastoroseomonas hellenica]
MPADDDESGFGAAFEAARIAGPILLPQFGPKPLPEARPLPILYFDAIRPQLDARDFVEDLLIEGSAALVYGESNAGKTFWATDLALHVAAGRAWNGRHVAQGGIVYCVLEGGIGFHNRVSAWRMHHGLEDACIPFAAVPSNLNLLDPDADTPRLIAVIREAAATLEIPVKLVVIDTLARAFAGGNENASEDMGALVGNMDAVRAATGCAFMFIHHSGKDRARGARGHSSLRAAIDTEIEVVARVDKDGAETDVKTATVVKQRDLRKGDAFDFALRAVTLGENPRGKLVTSCIVIPAPTPAAQAGQDPGAATDLRKIAQALGPDGQLSTARLCEALGWSRGTRAYQWLDTLVPLAPGGIDITLDGQPLRLWRTRVGSGLTSPIKIVRKDL